MSDETERGEAPLDGCESTNLPGDFAVPFDCYHLAAVRACRKGTIGASVNLMNSSSGKHEIVGVLLFHCGDVPDYDKVACIKGKNVIQLNAPIEDFDRLMALLEGDCKCEIGFTGSSDDEGHAYLKESCYRSSASMNSAT